MAAAKILQVGTDGMIDCKKYKTCLIDGCNTRPSFGTQFGSKNATHCSTHKLDGMINCVSKRCLIDGCNTLPSFGTQFGRKYATHCATHKLDGMIDCVHKRCLIDGCNTLPSFGTQFGKKYATHCTTHKLDGMINCVSKRCLIDGCNTQPHFGTHLIGKKYCSAHHNKAIHWKISTCALEKCRKIAIRSKSGTYPFKYCDDHAPIEYGSIHASKCMSCSLTDLICDENGDCLLSCSKIHNIRIKYSENEMMKFFTKKGLKFINDKSVYDGCSRSRPDFIFKTDYGILIVENDENQHRGYLCTCEQTRMIGIHQDCGENVHFIRFNPDRYRSLDSAYRICVDLHRRLEILYEYIRRILNNSLSFFEMNPYLTVRYMYYDGCDNESKWNEIHSVNY